MSFFSRSSSSNKHRYKQGHYGSKHYKKKGILNNIFNILNSSSRSHGNYKKHRNDFNETFHKQNTNISTICPKCKAPNSHGSKFCNNCGEKIENKQYCSSCGGNISLSDSFCPNCGKKA